MSAIDIELVVNGVTYPVSISPGRTSARDGELLVSVRVPALPPRSGSAYLRLEYRRAMEIAVVGAAAAVTLDASNAVVSIALALTAVAPTIIAVDVWSLVGGPLDAAALATVAAAASDCSTPISDVRASDDYRRHCVGIMARRAVEAAARRAGGESITVPVNRAYGIGAAR